ncbi:MAG: hypothetical protein M0Q38_01985 [Bacteroidales bacterium]|jgi:hypothetical protein|nr:hypothetical protein [Bacteroidales bacterium]
MKSVKFNDSELEFLINHYELELIDAENYIAELKNILKKLGATEKKTTEIASTAAEIKVKKGKPGRPRKIKPDSSITTHKKGKRGRPKKQLSEVVAPVPEKKEATPKQEVKPKKNRSRKKTKKTGRTNKVSDISTNEKPTTQPIVPAAESPKME